MCLFVSLLPRVCARVLVCVCVCVHMHHFYSSLALDLFFSLPWRYSQYSSNNHLYANLCIRVYFQEIKIKFQVHLPRWARKKHLQEQGGRSQNNSSQERREDAYSSRNSLGRLYLFNGLKILYLCILYFDEAHCPFFILQFSPHSVFPPHFFFSFLSFSFSFSFFFSLSMLCAAHMLGYRTILWEQR